MGAGEREAADRAVGQDTRFRVSADVVAQRMGDEVVLVHLGTNRIFDLSPTAARFWELVSAGTTVGGACRQILGEYAVGEAELAREVQALVGALTGEALLTVVEGD
jgi:hypothetical protein